MADIIAAIVKSFRKLTPLFLATAVATSAVLFMPSGLAVRLGIDGLPSGPRAWIGVTFLGSLSCLIALGVTSLHDRAHTWLAQRRHYRSQTESLEKLTATEKAYLIPYVVGQVNTARFAVSDGVVGGLEAKRILYRSSSVGEFFEFPFNLQPWAREILEAQPALLDGYSQRDFVTAIRRENAPGAIQELAEMGIRSDHILAMEEQTRDRQGRLTPNAD